MRAHNDFEPFPLYLFTKTHWRHIHAAFHNLPVRFVLCYLAAMSAKDLITVDPDILGGTPVFKGTRVPVKTLFDYLEDNYSLDEFLECFPSVTRVMACQILECSESALLEPVAA